MSIGNITKIPSVNNQKNLLPLLIHGNRTNAITPYIVAVLNRGIVVGKKHRSKHVNKRRKLKIFFLFLMAGNSLHSTGVSVDLPNDLNRYHGE